MQRAEAPKIAQVAAYYALAIRSKRDLLQTLFYATRNNAANAWTLHQGLLEVEQPHPDGSVTIIGDITARQELRDAKTTAEATAQDSAWALILILDYSLQRFASAAPETDSRAVGPEVGNGVKLNAAIWALANQARHLHDWEGRKPELLEKQQDVAFIRQMGFDPLNPNAAREFLCVTLRAVSSYIAFEKMLMQTAYDVLNGTEWRLGVVTAGTLRLDPVKTTIKPSERS
jgi:hypothetical protein